MKVLRSWTWLWLTVAAVIAFAFGWPGIVVQWAITALVIAFQIGRLVEHQRMERKQIREGLEEFTTFAERMLTTAPDELDDDQRVLRDQLQADYHKAQQMLRQLR